eukprot:UN05874
MIFLSCSCNNVIFKSWTTPWNRRFLSLLVLRKIFQNYFNF